MACGALRGAARRCGRGVAARPFAHIMEKYDRRGRSPYGRSKTGCGLREPSRGVPSAQVRRPARRSAPPPTPAVCALRDRSHSAAAAWPLDVRLGCRHTAAPACPPRDGHACGRAPPARDGASRSHPYRRARAKTPCAVPVGRRVPTPRGRTVRPAPGGASWAALVPPPHAPPHGATRRDRSSLAARGSAPVRQGGGSAVPRSERVRHGGARPAGDRRSRTRADVPGRAASAA